MKAVSDMGRPSQLRRVIQHLVPIEVKELKFHKEKEVLSQISLWLLEHGWCATTLDVDYLLCRVNIKFFTMLIVVDIVVNYF